MAYPFRPVKVPVVVKELDLKRKRSRRKTDLFLETIYPSRYKPTHLRKKLFSSPPR